MQKLPQLFEQNRRWSEDIRQKDPNFFQNLTGHQSPNYLWIGCADSRVPPTQLLGLMPGDVFVHRNVANVVAHSDPNCLAAVQYSVEALKVKHIIVCGHYSCGGVKAAFGDQHLGIVTDWIDHIRAVRAKHKDWLDTIPEGQWWERLCELNALEQAFSLCKTRVVDGAWSRGQDLTVHAWIYNLGDGLLKELGFSAHSSGERDVSYQQALVKIRNLE